MMNKENELLPCPFCGGAAEMIEIPHVPRGTDYTPRCKNTSCCGRLTKKWAYRETAVMMWNRRANEKQTVGEWIDTGDFELDNIYSGWKCSLCGHIFCGNKTNFCSNCGAKMKGGVE